jgi:hypothetical protein
MFLRIFSAALLVALTGCGSAPVAEDKVAAADPDDQIECALDGKSNFVRDCAIERGAGTKLTIRHGDGGFRRLTLDRDGSIDTADGADAPTIQTLSDGRTEIAVGGDRYRLPPLP